MVGVSKRQKDNAINLKEVGVCAWLSDRVTCVTHPANEGPLVMHSSAQTQDLVEDYSEYTENISEKKNDL